MEQEDVETESCASVSTYYTDDLECLHGRLPMPSISERPIDANSLPDCRPAESSEYPNWIIFEDLRTKSVVMRVNGVQVHDYWAPIAPLRDMITSLLLQDLNILITVRIREHCRSPDFTLDSDEGIMQYLYALRCLGKPLANVPSVRVCRPFIVECGHGTVQYD